MVRGRYAPSPSGSLHLGNLRTALLAWLFARSRGGSVLLRIEDLDQPRTRPGATTALIDDLAWLGFDWDEGVREGGLAGPYTQSARQALYYHALAVLREKDLLYPCYCTRAELQQIASAPHAGEHAHRYPGICAHLSERERRQLEASGRKPAFRFRVPTRPMVFHDLLCGEQVENVVESAGDFVVLRSDGIVAYQLAVVVDDALMGVTQVVRGADLLDSTARQLALFDALGFTRPAEYVHVPLVLDDTGNRMAKREAVAGLPALRARGLTPQEIVGALASSCGIWESGGPAKPADLVAVFNPSRISHDPSKIDLWPTLRDERLL